MQYQHLALSEKGFLKKLALPGMIAVSALFGAKALEATPVEWGSFEDITLNNTHYGGYIASYAANTVSFKDQSGNMIQSNPAFSLVYLLDIGGANVPVGGLDGSARSAHGWFNAEDGVNWYGLLNGQTANQTEGSMDNGYWRMFVDVNGNGKYGTYDSANGIFIPEEGEEISDVRVANFQGFQTGAGTLSAGDISGWYMAPQASTSALAALGVTALGGGTNKLTLSVAVSNAATFSVTYKNSLTNATWENLGSYSKTGAVTVITDTNSVPQRFYRVVAP